MPDYLPEYRIALEDLLLTMGIGIHAPERAAPQRVRLSVWLHCRYPARPEDRIEAVVDYDFLRHDILALVAGRHFDLQESLVEEVAALALRDPRVVRVRVKSVKPDVYPDATIGCEIERHRSRPNGENP